ncbi:hypothetical protein BaRGS_00030260 [Batillaria attramentaria]|uniref:Secreted protein n=1 Tax=Batillaria attramentaria TaxID=370345 RepID=A0ABD0JUK3_9CAEN
MYRLCSVLLCVSGGRPADAEAAQVRHFGIRQLTGRQPAVAFLHPLGTNLNCMMDVSFYIYTSGRASDVGFYRVVVLCDLYALHAGFSCSKTSLALVETESGD